ncbi:hypothetical protein JTB14_025027 [Gonioctena quinquepunctata]|nr:hypothetical protein JTB14_025027 [Gonioctena quinquepunctata]
MLKDGTPESRQICIHHITGTPLELLRKMAEAIFLGSSIFVDIYTTSTQESTSSIDRTNFRVLISEELQGHPRSIRSTKDGKLLMTLDEDHIALENLRTAVYDQGSLECRKLGSEKTHHIRGMCGDTTKEDIIGAVKNITGR